MSSSDVLVLVLVLMFFFYTVFGLMEIRSKDQYIIVVFAVVICLPIQIIRQKFYRSVIRRQVLVEQNISPSNNRDDEIAPVRFIWHILDKYNIPILTNLSNNNIIYTAPNYGTNTANNTNNNNNIV